LIEASGTRAPVVTASDGINWLSATDTSLETSHTGHGHDDHDHDPHGWQTVVNARQYVKNITAALCAADAPGCALYHANLDTYLKALEELDKDIRAHIGKVPKNRRTAVTNHAAFRYFGKAYGVRFIAARGLSAAAQTRPATLARLIKSMRSQSVTGMFLDNVTNPRVLQQLARDTGARIGGTLYSDALTGADGPAPTYIDMMRHNAATLATTLRDK
jgi:zinc/manganese transport system substrate-binding protein